MLDVDGPPKLGHWSSMSYDELYSGSMDSTKFDSDGASSELTEVATPTSAIRNHNSTVQTCQEFPIANAHARSREIELNRSYFVVTHH